MELHSRLDSLPDSQLKNCVTTWGIFDGVHIGHQKVLDDLASWARGRGTTSLVITFDPHPAEVLRGTPVPLVTTLGQRTRLIGEHGIGHLLLIPFTREFSETTAEEFVRAILVDRIGVSGVLLGHDSHFGKDRAGDFELFDRVEGLEVRRVEPEHLEGSPISSGKIRDAIRAGDLEAVRALLGRLLSLEGTVVPGKGRGRTIGVPTANVNIRNGVQPPNGVYSVRAEFDGNSFPAVANLGTRPTFESGGEVVLEVHLLEAPGEELCGKEMEVHFRFLIREEKKFSGPGELKKQVEQDIATVRRNIP